MAIDRGDGDGRKAASDGWPERVGAYRILEPLGAGGMGQVCLALDERLRRKVAVKRVRLDRRDPGHRRRFLREAQAAASLSHPSVVQIHDIVEEAAGDYIIMEYVPGTTLAEMLRRGPLQPGQAAALAALVARGLEEAHARGLVHRDLKAENVVVTDSGAAKILDFGLAKTVRYQPEDGGEEPGHSEAGLTEPGTVLGTSRSMSPEQAAGREVDHRSDLFSLGVLIYEMIAGTSPFLGESPLKTLNKVLTEHPPPLAELRPQLDPDLSGLVEALLEKDRDRRPSSTAEVRMRLEQSSGRFRGMPPDHGITSLPTGPMAPAPGLSAGGRPQTPATVAPAGRRMGGRWRWPALLLLLLSLSGLGYHGWRGSAPPDLRVAILPPEISPDAAPDGDLSLTGSAAGRAALETLVALRGIAPLAPVQAAGLSSGAAATAKALAADEVLRISLEGRGDLCRITLTRISGRRGEVLWTSSFPAPAETSEAATAAEAVRVHLREGFPEHPVREGFPDLRARPEDFEAFLRLSRRVEAGERPLQPFFEEAARIVGSSPRLLAAHHLAADIALSLFSRSKDPSDYQKALRYIDSAGRLAPGDLRHRVNRVRLAMEDDRLQEAREAVLKLEAAHPGDATVLTLHSDIAAQQGKPEEAIAIMRRLVDRHPAWQSLYRLADLELRLARVDEARTRLQQLLRRVPGNRWGLSKLGQLELLYGDLQEAEAIYLELTQESPSRSFFTNLGLSRYLQRRHWEAIGSYQEALRISPDHRAVLLNLADARAALGHGDEARSLYRDLLNQLDRPRGEATLRTADRLIRAQCLAGLGRAREAVESVQGVLAENPDDSQSLYVASLVYAVAGDRVSALVNAQKSMERGVQHRWFHIAPFEELRGQADFRALLQGAASFPTR